MMSTTQENFHYWPYYCEENIWHLCGMPRFQHHSAYAVLISNPEDQVALWGQKAALGPAEPVIWDYHVILIADSESGWQVWDLDTLWGLPCAATTYLLQTFLPLEGPSLIFAPRFGVLPAAEYRRQLRSDRRHMRLENGEYSSPPPPWPTIGQGSNLATWVAMGNDFPGESFDLAGLTRLTIER